ncbi:hypothetical protein HPB51_029260 [Rhipicephalus microplus]|uniref:BUB1 N-terminal domain-containing protein n=1 Tax=Rhipicephalus microplus TaxID=6941 RepID=A0A9J6CUN2_RHIMP|nr:hypothetical protein HPB51_029260 [Rhipicephalus microplus]
MQDGDCELSKEDIQPLKQGRVMSSLQAALAPQCQEDLTQKRREFEEELRTSSGVTLLDVYHRYVLWLEQHHVTTSVNMPQLLEQAIVQFKTNTELFNDVRYVGIWIRYAMMSPEPLATFKAMFEAGIGDQHAEFYATWAQQLEASGDTCGASRVLQGAIHRRATPTSRLEAALGHLEARVSCQATLTYAASKSFDLKVTSTPCATDHTVPKVGEDFTVGGLTALVQDLAILSRSASSAAQIPPVEPLEPPQQVEQQQPSQPGVPLSPKTDTAAPLATRRFSIAAAVDLHISTSAARKANRAATVEAAPVQAAPRPTILAAGSTLSTTARPHHRWQPARCPGGTRQRWWCLFGGSSHARAVPGTGAKMGEQAVRAVASEDPFSEEMRSIILASWQPQKSDQRKLLESPAKRPIVKGNALITLGDHKIRVLRRVASGAYAAVYLAQMIKTEETYLDDDESFEAPSQERLCSK